MIFTPSREKIASMIDHTNLKADATSSDIERLCKEATNYGFYSVCINPCNIEKAGVFLNKYSAQDKCGVKICSVIGFPLGASQTEIKEQEATYALCFGSDEIDMVMNIGEFKDKNYNFVREDIKAVVKQAREIEKIENKIDESYKSVVKVIIETCYLSSEEIIEACKLVSDSGAGYIKTSTGFGPAGATVENVALMKKTIDSLGSGLKIKAAGGISNLETALSMIYAGADRLGCSKSVNIIKTI